MLNELNCTFHFSFLRLHCCGRHGHGLWSSWFVAVMVMVCGRRGLWPSWSWFVVVVVCGRHGIGRPLTYRTYLLTCCRERYLKTWVPSVSEQSQLSDSDITEFVNGMTTVASLAMFNKIGSNDSSAAMQCLAMLRPEIIIPPLLDMYVLALHYKTLIIIIIK